MKELPSNEFRRTFNKLREPIVVTVNGHPIATYNPISSAVDQERRLTLAENYAIQRGVVDEVGRSAARKGGTKASVQSDVGATVLPSIESERRAAALDAFAMNDEPAFRPAPKPGKKVR